MVVLAGRSKSVEQTLGMGTKEGNGDGRSEEVISDLETRRILKNKKDFVLQSTSITPSYLVRFIYIHEYRCQYIPTVLDVCVHPIIYVIYTHHR